MLFPNLALAVMFATCATANINPEVCGSPRWHAPKDICKAAGCNWKYLGKVSNPEYGCCCPDSQVIAFEQGCEDNRGYPAPGGFIC